MVFVIEKDNDGQLFPKKVRLISDEELQYLLDLTKSTKILEDSTESLAEEMSDKVGLFQEVIMSPMRALMSPGLASSQTPSYRDCQKAFNFVFNYCQTQKNGTSKLMASLWDTYNDMVSSNWHVVLTTGNVVSFPEVHTTPTYCRKRTAGYL